MVKPATITLTSALPAITRPVRIDAPEITINANGVGRGLYITGASVRISDLTITRGVTPAIGGAIYGKGSNNLSLQNVTLVDNTAGQRGGGIAIEAASSITITDSTISGNTISSAGGLNVRAGGGVHVGGLSQVTLTRSTISNNTSQFMGGGIYNESSVTVIDSLVSNNQSGMHGGGIYTKGSSVTNIENSTISSNTATQSAGGLQGYNAFNIRFSNVTLAANEASQYDAINVFGTSGPVAFNNTIVAYQGATDCRITSLAAMNASSIIESGACDAAASGGRVLDPGILPLADNGGPTLTHALANNSPAINTGNNAICPDADQRGEPRPANGANSCDVGAFEAPDSSSFFIIPTKNGKATAIEL